MKLGQGTFGSFGVHAAVGAVAAIVGISRGAQAGPVSLTHDYHKVQAALKALATQYPQNVELFQLGTSGTGESIDGIKIGHGQINNLIVATHHGNEYGSTEVALGSAADLAKSPIANQTIWIIPVLNISGFDHDRREESLVGNTDDDNTADANRDYPGPCGTEGPFHLKSTKALADFIAAHNIVASATLHTFYPVVAYPWGFTTPDLSTPYDKLFIDLATVATTYSKYPVGNSSEAIYPANGTFEDYAFWKHGIWSLLFELGDTHNPSEAQLADLVRKNVPGLRAMMEKRRFNARPITTSKGAAMLGFAASIATTNRVYLRLKAAVWRAPAGGVGARGRRANHSPASAFFQRNPAHLRSSPGSVKPLALWQDF